MGADTDRADGLTPELIEAAAKLCGWAKTKDWHAPYTALFRDADGLSMITGSGLTTAGLLALEDALGDAGWVWDKVGDEGGTLCYRWRQWFPFGERRTVADECLHPDRATAACLAAQAELEGK